MRTLLGTIAVFISIMGMAAARDATLADAAELIRESFPDTRMYVLGELHGTVEAPALVAELAGAFLSEGPVTVALEVPVDEQAAVDRFMRSKEHSRGLSDLVSGLFWQRPRDCSDGRRSEAMLDLFVSLRDLNLQHDHTLSVLLFDPGSTDDRNRLMAERIAVLADGQKRTRIVVLTGNYHARRTQAAKALSNGKTIAPPRPMASYLREHDFVSVDIAARSGSFWACVGSCGVQRIRTSANTQRRTDVEIERLDASRQGHDARLWLPRYTASQPVDPADPDRKIRQVSGEKGL